MPPRVGKKYYHGNEKQILTKHEEALGKDTKQHNNNTLFHEPRHGIYEIIYAMIQNLTAIVEGDLILIIKILNYEKSEMFTKNINFTGVSYSG